MPRLRDPCDPCDVRVTVDVEDAVDGVVDVAINCCDEPRMEWRRRDKADEHVYDRFAMWNDAFGWDDDKTLWDSPVFEVHVTCVPLGLQGVCWYDTNDAVAYMTGSGQLYGACK